MRDDYHGQARTYHRCSYKVKKQELNTVGNLSSFRHR